MSVAHGVAQPPQLGEGRRKHSLGAIMMIAAGIVSSLVSLLLVAGAAAVVITDALPDVDAVMTVIMVVVLSLLGLFAAALGWLAIRQGKERLANPPSFRYPGF